MSPSQTACTCLAFGLLVAALGGCFGPEEGSEFVTIEAQSFYPEDRGIEHWLVEEGVHSLTSFEGGDSTPVGSAKNCMGSKHPHLNAVVWTSDDGFQQFWSPDGERRLTSASWILPSCVKDYTIELDAHGALGLYYCEDWGKPPYGCRKGDVIAKA